MLVLSVVMYFALPYNSKLQETAELWYKVSCGHQKINAINTIPVIIPLKCFTDELGLHEHHIEILMGQRTTMGLERKRHKKGV